MNTRICISIFLQVLLLGSTLSQSTPAPQTPQEIVQAALTTVKNFKTDFENVKLKREREFRNRLFDTVYAAYDALFRSLEEELFKPEDNKAIALIDALNNSPDQQCVNRLREFITEVKDKEARPEYRYCALVLESDINQMKERFSEAQENVNTLLTESEQKIQGCLRVNGLRSNTTQLQACVQIEAQANLKTAQTIFENSLQNLTVQSLVSNVASCIDKAVVLVKKSLKTNYEQIQQCLQSSDGNLEKQIAEFLPSYQYNVSSNAQAEVIIALANLKAKPNVTLAKAVSVKIKVDQTITRKNRNAETIRALLETNANVVKYQIAFRNASLALGFVTAARGCVTDAESRIRSTLNSRSSEVKQCLDGIRQTVSVDNINTLETDILERQKGEAQVAVVRCLAYSGVVSQNNTVVCSAQTDLVFDNYLLSVDQKLNEASQKADVISAQIDACEKTVVPSILSSFATNKFIFDSCLAKALVSFTLNYE